MKYIALFSSMAFESDTILANMNNIHAKEIARKTVYQGKLSKTDVLLMNTGIGKVNAAHAATAVIEHFPIKHVINSGIGGAYPESGLEIGDAAIATKEVYGDEGVISPGGWSDMRAIGIPVVQAGRKKYFNEFPLSLALSYKGREDSLISPPLMGGDEGEGVLCSFLDKICVKGPYKLKSGAFVTVSTATGTHKRAKELEKRFHAICENMEGAALAHICTIYDVPMLEIRGISNIAGVRDKRKWDLKLASENCQKIVLEAIKYSI